MKNESLLECREVRHATPNKSKKYPMTNENSSNEDMGSNIQAGN
jgi:hypothetical protein